jgi:hypothetical protein
MIDGTDESVTIRDQRTGLLMAGFLAVVLGGFGIAIAAALIKHAQNASGAVRAGCYVIVAIGVVAYVASLCRSWTLRTYLTAGAAVRRSWPGGTKRIPFAEISAVKLFPLSYGRGTKFFAPNLSIQGGSGTKITFSNTTASQVCQQLAGHIGPAQLADGYTQARWRIWSDSSVTDDARKPYFDPKAAPPA